MVSEFAAPAGGPLSTVNDDMLTNLTPSEHPDWHSQSNQPQINLHDNWFGPPSAATKAKLGRKNIAYQARALDRAEGAVECAAVLLELSIRANVANRFTAQITKHDLARRCGMTANAVRLALHDLNQGQWIAQVKTNTFRLNTETIRRAYVATK